MLKGINKMITVIKRNGKTEPLDIAKIQKYTAQAVRGIYDEYSVSFSNLSPKEIKQKLSKLREKFLNFNILKQQLIQQVELLTKAASSAQSSFITTFNLLKNIFGSNNSSESDNIK